MMCRIDLRPSMRTLPRYALAAALSLVAAASLAVGCGNEEELDVKEGEPVEVGELRFNVQLTRFLNPTDVEDRDYLVERQPAPPGREYLGVFVEIENEGDSAVRPPAGMEVLDTQDNVYRPLPNRSLYGLNLTAPIPPGGEVPAPDTTAASGPIQGSMILFLVSEDVTENRPLELEIPNPGGETARIELDI